ncbi:MAG: LD-carboxypeptidase [Clostridium sp.]|nr:LD-carboxypeptidase [Clostridium sp.]
MKSIGLISLSNGLKEKQEEIINSLESFLKEKNINIIKSDTIYEESENISFSPKKRAYELMKLYKDDSIDIICDVSGGDLANEVLEFLDFEYITNHYKPYFGYSDLSVILNSLYAKTNTHNYLYQIRNIALDKTSNSLNDFISFINEDNDNLLNFSYKWLQGEKMEGTLVGGNLRCSLKLAGTKYMPDFKDKILLIESLGGNVAKITTYLTCYKLLGAFEKCNGIILGSFTEMERDKLTPTVEELIIRIVDNKDIPIIKTSEIGHAPTSKATIIGGYYKFNEDTMIINK